MHITAISTPDGPRSVVTHADGSPVDPDTVKQALEPLRAAVAAPGGGADGAAVAPVRPGKVVALGLNYSDDARETRCSATTGAGTTHLSEMDNPSMWLRGGSDRKPVAGSWWLPIWSVASPTPAHRTDMAENIPQSRPIMFPPAPAGLPGSYYSL